MLSTASKAMEASRRSMKRKNLLRLTVVALSTTSVQAWVLPDTTPATLKSRGFHTVSPRKTFFLNSEYKQYPRFQRFPASTRLYSTNKDEGFLSKIGKKVKSFLPTKIFGSEEEKQKLARKKEYKEQVTGGLDAMLKDAPLGMRMMGKMISPLVSSVASNLADAMAEQQRTTEGLMDDARGYLMGDSAVSNLIGEPISLGAPFSQSSSTTSINGQTQTRVELGMPVSGSRGSGTVRVLASQNGIEQMQLDAAGQRINVSLSRKGSTSSSPYGSSSSQRGKGDDNIIEAEVIDKDTKY